MQETKLPTLDIRLDEIDAIEPERGDDRIEGGQCHDLLGNPAPAVSRRSEMSQAEAEAAAIFDGHRQCAETRDAAERQWQHHDVVEPMEVDDPPQDRARLASGRERIDPALPCGPAQHLCLL